MTAWRSIAAATAALLLAACASGPPLPPGSVRAGQPMPPMGEGVTGSSGRAKFDTPPRRLSGDAPQYPRHELVQGAAGSALVEFTVDVDGMTRDFKVVRATEPAFGTAAVVAVQGWRFAPALKDGRPVAIRAQQHFDFKMR